MENYIREVLELCKLPYNEISKEYKVSCVGGKYVHITNFKKIIDYTDTKIVLKLSKKIKEIVGENLEIKQLNKGEIIIIGIINFFDLGGMHENKK